MPTASPPRQPARSTWRPQSLIPALPGLLAALLGAAPALASRPFTPEELLATRRPDDPQVSPDGRWVAFTVRVKSLAENRDVRDVWAVPAQGGTPRQLTRDGKSEQPRWSPDGRTLLVASSRSGEGQLWLYDVGTTSALRSSGAPVLELAGGDPRQLTNLWGGAAGGVFSRDGRTLAFTSEVFPACNGDDACNRKTAAEREAGKLKARIADHLFVRHWSEWNEGKRTHLFVLPLGAPGAAPAPQPRDLTPGDGDWPTWRLGDGDCYDFSPDGTQLAVSHKAPAKQAWSTNSDIYLVPVAGGPPKNLTESNPGDDLLPRFSPDGRFLAFLSQARDGYEADQRKLRLLDRRTGKTRVIGDLDDDVLSFVWRADSKGVVAPRIEKGRIYLEQIGVDGKVARFSPHPAGPDFALGNDGTVFAVTSGMNRPPELSQISPGEKPKALTGLNTEQYAGIELGPVPEELWVEGRDGKKIHSWILKPPGLAPGAKAPLILLIHGGPQGAWEDLWGMRWNPAAFAARGYAVLMPNTRGSFGYGHGLVEQISKDWGGLAYDDLLRATDAAEKLPFVEAGRTCAAGASFGGYMIDWIAGHTDRYRCLVTHDGVFDLRSMYGATEEIWFPEFEFGGPYWEQPEQYAKWSPSSYVQGFKTPTLVVQGELDYRVPGEQGLQMFTALQRRGVESRLLWFPDEGHWVQKPRNSQLWYRTVLDWIDQHARSAPGGKG